MKLSELKKKYKHFERVSFTIKIDDFVFYPVDGLTLIKLHINTCYESIANLAEVELEIKKDKKKAFKTLQTGSLIQIYGGYQKNEELLFQGYLDSLSFHCQDGNILDSIELYAQDVTGLMMLHKRSFTQKGGKKSTIIQEIFHDSFYKNYVHSVSAAVLEKSMDSEYYIVGQSDYDVLVSLCNDSFYAFYVVQDQLKFKKRFCKPSSILVLDITEDLFEITQKTTLENQIGSMIITTCDGYHCQKKAQQKYTLSGLPQTEKMKSILSHNQAVTSDEGYHGMEELNYLIKAIETEVKYSYGSINGKSVFLPQLQIANGIELPKFADGRMKKAFLTSVIHHYDDEEVYSEWEARLEKG